MRCRRRSSTPPAATACLTSPITTRPDALGVGPTPRNARDGVRMSAALTYLAGARPAVSIASRVSTYHHPVGTCRMGADPDGGAVVAARGRVHGIEHLHVA